VPVPRISFFSPARDSRANQLIKYGSVWNPETGQHFINARCVEDVADQIEMVLEGRNPRRVAPREEKWTHRFAYDGSADSSIITGLDLLEQVLTLVEQDELDGALALDWHMVPDDELPPDQWPRTEVGELLYKAKYRGNHGALISAARRITAVIARHPYFYDLDSIAVPGSSTFFGIKLAREVASLLGVSMNGCSRVPGSNQMAAKNGRDSLELDPYEFGCDLSGQRVVIVDDLYRTGVTMRSTAVAARSAGAINVLGVAGTRVLRRR
jgi:hypothetical protein